MPYTYTKVIPVNPKCPNQSLFCDIVQYLKKGCLSVIDSVWFDKHF